MSKSAEQFLQVHHGIPKRSPPPYQGPLVSRHFGRVFSGITFSILNFTQLFLQEGNAHWTGVLPSHTRIISPTCLSAGGGVIVQIEWETEVSAS